jgi:hypothetical protein
VVVFGPDANCTLEICPVEISVYGYRPSLAANFVFIALYALSMTIHLYLGVRWKHWWYMGCMLVGGANAIVGYAGRVMLYYNPFSFVAFMIQIGELILPECFTNQAHNKSMSLTKPLLVCVTSGPVYYCAAIYVTLSMA